MHAARSRYAPATQRPARPEPLRRGARDMGLMTVRDEFIKAKNRAQRSPKTQAVYTQAVTQFIKHVIYHTRRDRLSDFTAEMVKTWLDHLEQKPTSRATRSLYLTALREFARYGLRERLWLTDPLLTIDAIPRPKTLPRPFTHEERAALMALDLPLVEQALRALLNFAGLRDDEVCAIQLRHFTRPSRLPDGSALPATLHVYGKGRKERVMPLHPECWAAVEQYAVSKVDVSPAAYLFSIADTGRRWSTAMIRTRVHRWGNCGRASLHTWLDLDPRTRGRCAACARVESCTPHRFRHRFGTDLLEADVHPRKVQDLMGHASLATTEIYMQVVDKGRNEAILRLPSHRPESKSADYGHGLDAVPGAARNPAPDQEGPR